MACACCARAAHGLRTARGARARRAHGPRGKRAVRNADLANCQRLGHGVLKYAAASRVMPWHA
eukprot:1983536-Lingulodinium_polyedra.AAC.1